MCKVCGIITTENWLGKLSTTVKLVQLIVMEPFSTVISYHFDIQKQTHPPSKSLLSTQSQLSINMTLNYMTIKSSISRHTSFNIPASEPSWGILNWFYLMFLSTAVTLYKIPSKPATVKQTPSWAILCPNSKIYLDNDNIYISIFVPSFYLYFTNRFYYACKHARK